MGGCLGVELGQANKVGLEISQALFYSIDLSVRVGSPPSPVFVKDPRHTGCERK